MYMCFLKCASLGVGCVCVCVCVHVYLPIWKLLEERGARG